MEGEKKLPPFLYISEKNSIFVKNKDMERELCKEAIEYMESPIKVDDFVSFEKNEIYTYEIQGETYGYVKNISEDGSECEILVQDTGCSFDNKIVKLKIEVVKKNPLFIGYDPMSLIQKPPRLNLVSYEIGSILSIVSTDFRLGEYYVTGNDGKKYKMEELNWNPYVIDRDGNKQYYQRDFCWTVEDKQNLIESIYREIDCGKIVLRTHSYEEVEKELKNGNEGFAFHDIVDGKQRLNALLGFIANEFPDKNGKYYKDFSTIAKRKFEHKLCFTLARLDERTTDEDVLKVFMLVNYAGKEMSKEHLEYVDSIMKKM